MRTVSIVIIAVAAFVVGVLATYVVVHRSAPSAAPAVSPLSESGDKKILYWYDPMKPDQRFDKPGQSPYMNMPLLPKYAEETSAGAVQIDPRLAQSLGVRTTRAQRGTLARTLRATGTVAFDERAITAVQSRVAGIVEQLHVRAPLTAVRRGQPLATLLAPDWTAAQEDYLALRRTPSTGLDTLRTAARQRLVLSGMDEGTIRDLERSGRAQLRFTITAPRDGVVAELAVRDGARVAAGAPLMMLNGLDTVWVNAAIAEADAAQIAPGMAATATFPAFPGDRIEGSIEALLPDLDPATRTQRARIVLANPQHRLAPGMFASIEIAAPASSAQILVPSEAVIETGARNVVIVDDGNGRYRAREVRIGTQAGGKTAVLDGLAEGDNVVLSGQFLIDSEASLSGALTRLGAAEEKSARPPDAGGDASYASAGTVERIEGTHWSIAADPIPALGMGAMTMTFVVPANLPNAKAVLVGQRMAFRFVRNGGGDFEIVEITTPVAPVKGEKP